MTQRSVLHILACLLVANGALAAEPVAFDFAKVGDPGNPPTKKVTACCDQRIEPGTERSTGYGSVDYVFRISRSETTVAQYVEFLNSVAASDPHGLWSRAMGEGHPHAWAVMPPIIERTGSAGSYTYGAVAGRERFPVIFVGYFDALRFANWLHNGRRSKPKTTESGCYDLKGEDPDVPRGKDCRFWLPNENEWYKAAFYDPKIPRGQDPYHQFGYRSSRLVEGRVPKDASEEHHANACPLRDYNGDGDMDDEVAVEDEPRAGRERRRERRPGKEGQRGRGSLPRKERFAVPCSAHRADSAPKPACSYPGRSYYGLCDATGNAFEMVERNGEVFLPERGSRPVAPLRGGPWWQAAGDNSATGRNWCGVVDGRGRPRNCPTGFRIATTASK